MCLFGSHASLKPGMCPSMGSWILSSSSIEPPRLCSPRAALSSGESWGDWRRRRSPPSSPSELAIREASGTCGAWPALPAALLLARDARMAAPEASPPSCAPAESSLYAAPLPSLPAGCLAGSGAAGFLRKRRPSSPTRAGKTAEETWPGSGGGSVLRARAKVGPGLRLGLAWGLGLGLGQGLGSGEGQDGGGGARREARGGRRSALP